MFVLLYNAGNGSLQSKSFSDLDEAHEEMSELTEKNVTNVRLLTDVVDEDYISPYKELYWKLYNDFVKPKPEIHEDAVSGFTEIEVH